MIRGGRTESRLQRVAALAATQRALTHGQRSFAPTSAFVSRVRRRGCEQR
jgi:hypothetical protein